MMHLNGSTSSSIDLSGSKQVPYIAMNQYSKFRVNLMADGCANKCFYTIGNDLVSKISVVEIRNVRDEVSSSERKLKLVGFDRDLSKKSIMTLINIDLMYVPIWGPTQWRINNIA